jgi:hydroxyacylglutathione hydrolase
MRIRALPAFSDNYIWMWDDGVHAAVVDPGDAAPVLSALRDDGLTLQFILVTHHHADHTAGIPALRPELDGPVYGPRRESIPQPCVGLDDGEVIEVLGRRLEVLSVPGHTAGHIAYFAPQAEEGPLLFCGDTLFSAGCGRLFEGTPAQMQASLSRLADLPASTKVYCTHEYTLSNLAFAATVEPSNLDIQRHKGWCEAERASGRPTLPSTIGRERLINPFLRCEVSAVIDAAAAQGAAGRDPVSVLAALREWKNRFR